MSNTAAVTNDIQAGIAGLQLLIDLYFHIVELDFHTVQQRIIICRTGGNFIQGINHLDNAIQDPLWQNQSQITGSCLECGGDKGLRWIHRIRWNP